MIKNKLLNSYGASFIRKNREMDDKPNEDFIIVDNEHKIFIVCDGVTRSSVNEHYPNPSPAATASALFAKTVQTSLIDLLLAATPKKSLIKAIKNGNEAVAEFNKYTFPKIDYFANDFAGTVAIIGLIRNNKFYYAYIGDCSGYLITTKATSRFTTSQTDQIETYRKKFGFSKETTIKIRRDFRNNKLHPLGYGVFTGEPTALDFVEFGSLRLKADQKILLTSDGVSPLLEYESKLYFGISPETIISQTEMLEDKFGIRSDDKAVVIISIT